MHHPAEHSPLGKSSQYVSQYAPELLFQRDGWRWRLSGVDLDPPAPASAPAA